VNNFLLQTDSYKVTHWPQYPKGTQTVYSYLESRGGQFPETVFFGLRYYLKKYLQGVRVYGDNIREASEITRMHFGRDLFNGDGWRHILRDHNGHLPLRIKAPAEGVVVPVHNVLMTIENTCPQCYWLTNYVESVLLKVWYPITVATLSREIKKTILAFLHQTGDPSTIDFKLHDFGYRGVSSEESAAIGGAAHLVNFKGTDTFAGLMLAREFYGEAMAGFSVPASEHSTITSWGREHEVDAYRNMLTTYPEGLVACVSDSYDIFNACENLWGGVLREEVNKRNGTLIVRPDSGDPATVVLKCLEILGGKFGYTTNSKGYKVLSPRVRVIQGDGVNQWSIRDILGAMAGRGWSADNLAFGMGGKLLQGVDRDTQKFAIKCSSITINGEEQDVYKQPVTDSGKDSKRGRLSLVDVEGDLRTIPEYPGGTFGDLLETVFENGEIVQDYTFRKIRERAVIDPAIFAEAVA
jgi:nicotinamide phosphoribosyltransferase